MRMQITSRCNYYVYTHQVKMIIMAHVFRNDEFIYSIVCIMHGARHEVYGHYLATLAATSREREKAVIIKHPSN